MKNYGYSDREGQKKVNMLPVFVAIGIFVGIGIILCVIKAIDAVEAGSGSILPAVAPILILCPMLVSVFRLSKQWKEEPNQGAKTACGRGPDRGAESLPAGMSGMEDFFVKRPLSNMVAIDQVYHVLNADDTKILEAKLDMSGFGKWVVENNDGECVGTIQHSGGITNLDHYEVQIGNEEPFTLQRNFDLGKHYNVEGLDYSVSSTMHYAHLDVFDLYGNIVATMENRRMEGGWMAGNENRVTMAPGVENNIYIVFLMLCLFIEKEHKEI